MQSVCQIEKTVLGHGDVTFEVARAVEFSPCRKVTLSPTEASLLKSDCIRAIAIAKGLLQAFGGIATITGESQLVGSWNEVEELLEGNSLRFDSVKIEFQEAREEPLLLLNVVVGFATLPPLWQIHFERTRGTSVDCVVEVRTSQCVARLAEQYTQPFDCNELLVGC